MPCLCWQVCIALSPKAAFVKHQMAPGSAAPPPSPAGSLAAKAAAARAAAAARSRTGTQQAATGGDRRGTSQARPLAAAEVVATAAAAAGGKAAGEGASAARGSGPVVQEHGAQSSGLVLSPHGSGSRADAVAETPQPVGRYEKLGYTSSSPSSSSNAPSSAHSSPGITCSSSTAYASPSRGTGGADRSSSSSSRALRDSGNHASPADDWKPSGPELLRSREPYLSSRSMGKQSADSKQTGGGSSSSSMATGYRPGADINRPLFPPFPEGVTDSSISKSSPNGVDGLSGDTIASKNALFSDKNPLLSNESLSSRSSSRPRSRSASRGRSYSRVESSQDLEHPNHTPSAPMSYLHQQQQQQGHDDDTVRLHECEATWEPENRKLLRTSVRSDEGSVDMPGYGSGIGRSSRSSGAARKGGSWWRSSSTTSSRECEEGIVAAAAAAGEQGGVGLAAGANVKQNTYLEEAPDMLSHGYSGGDRGFDEYSRQKDKATLAAAAGHEAAGANWLDQQKQGGVVEQGHEQNVRSGSSKQYPGSTAAAAAAAEGRRFPVGWAEDVRLQEDQGVQSVKVEWSSSKSSSRKQAVLETSSEQQVLQAAAAAPGGEEVAGAVAVRRPVGWSKAVDCSQRQADQGSVGEQVHPSSSRGCDGSRPVDKSGSSSRPGDVNSSDHRKHRGEQIDPGTSGKITPSSSDGSIGSSISSGIPAGAAAGAGSYPQPHSTVSVNDTRVFVEEALLDPGSKSDAVTGDRYAAGMGAGAGGRARGWAKGTAKRFQGALKGKQEGGGGFGGFEDEDKPSWMCNRKVGLSVIAVLLLLVLGGVTAGVVYLKKVKDADKQQGKEFWGGWAASKPLYADLST